MSRALFTIACALLTGCAWTGTQCPHTPEEVAPVRDYITIERKGYFDLVDACNGDGGSIYFRGCYDPSERTAYILDTLRGGEEVSVVHHEMCHAYRRIILEVPARDEARHLYWK